MLRQLVLLWYLRDRALTVWRRCWGDVWDHDGDGTLVGLVELHERGGVQPPPELAR